MTLPFALQHALDIIKGDFGHECYYKPNSDVRMAVSATTTGVGVSAQISGYLAAVRK